MARMAGWEFSVRSSCSAGPSAMSVARAHAQRGVRLREHARPPASRRGRDPCPRTANPDRERRAPVARDGPPGCVWSATLQAGALRPPTASSANPTKLAATGVWNMCKDARIWASRPHRPRRRPGPPEVPPVTADRRSQGLLDPVVQAARDELGAAGLPGDRILVLRAIWRDLITGFALAAERARPGLPPADHAVHGGGHRLPHRRGPGGAAGSIAVCGQSHRVRPGAARTAVAGPRRSPTGVSGC